MIIFSESPKDYEKIIMSRAERVLFLQSQFIPIITVINYITIMTQKCLERHACIQQTQYKVIASFLQGKHVHIF